MKLRRAPVLFNEIELTVIFGIKVAQMAARFDMLLELRLLRDEVGLGEKDMSAATTERPLRAFDTSAFDGESTLGPKAALANDLFHPFEPPGKTRVVIGEIETLALTGRGIDAIAHAWPVRIMCPVTLGISDIDKKIAIKKKKKGRTFHHFFGGYGIAGTLQVAECVIEHEEALGKAICLALEDVDHMINLGDELFGVEIPIAIFSWLEHEMSLPEEQLSIYQV
jgi:hypothetical protein